MSIHSIYFVGGTRHGTYNVVCEVRGQLPEEWLLQIDMQPSPKPSRFPRSRHARRIEVYELRWQPDSYTPVYVMKEVIEE